MLYLLPLMVGIIITISIYDLYDLYTDHRRKKVDEYKVGEILDLYLSSLKSEYNRKFMVYPEITKNGVVKIHTNIPGIIIGKHGETINAIKGSLISHAKARDVKIVEMKHFLTNIDDLY